MTAPHCEHDRYLVNVYAYAQTASRRILDADALMAMARLYVCPGAVRHQGYCPRCHRKARLAVGADRCSSCVGAAIDEWRRSLGWEAA